MKTEDILNLDYRKEENQEAIQRVLRKIKPLSKFSEDENIPFEKLEKLIGLYQNKYAIKIQYIIPYYKRFHNGFRSFFTFFLQLRATEIG